MHNFGWKNINTRPKNQKLSFLERKWLFDKLDYEWISVKELSKTFSISKGALSRIKHDHRLSSKPVGTQSIFWLSQNEEGAVVECIKEFLGRNIYQFNANDVYNHVQINLGINLPIHKIRNILRENFYLSYKRINSRSCFINVRRLKLARMLFSIRLLSTIYQSILLINIDETLITKDTKSNYSWTPIGQNSEAWNSRFKSSLNLVLAVFLNGSWIEMLSNNTLTTDRFIVFLIILKKFLEENNYFEFKRIIIMLDNLSSHRTDKVLNKWLKCNFDLCYIPPYSPSLAPVKHTFGIFKKIFPISKK